MKRYQLAAFPHQGWSRVDFTGISNLEGGGFGESSEQGDMARTHPQRILKEASLHVAVFTLVRKAVLELRKQSRRPDWKRFNYPLQHSVHPV